MRQTSGNLSLAAVIGLIWLIGPAFGGAKEKKEPETCVHCHQKMIQAKVVHMVAFDEGEEACDTCHEASEGSTEYKAGSKHKFEQINVAEKCAECHDFSEENNLHKPVKEGQCIDCHNPHASNQSALLVMPSEDLCEKCHSGVGKEGKGSSHMATELIQGCGNCHQPHASEHGSLLKKPQRELCLDCHQRPFVLKDRVVKNISLILNDKENSVHSPVEDDCTTCHNPHASSNLRLLTAPFAPEWYGPPKVEAYELCYECHDSDAISVKEGEATEFRHGKRNLHAVHVLAKPKGRSCITCHGVHAAPGEHYLQETVPFFSYQVPINFSSTDDGGICFPACHEKMEYNREAEEAEPEPKKDK